MPAGLWRTTPSRFDIDCLPDVPVNGSAMLHDGEEGHRTGKRSRASSACMRTRICAVCNVASIAMQQNLRSDAVYAGEARQVHASHPKQTRYSIAIASVDIRAASRHTSRRG